MNDKWTKAGEILVTHFGLNEEFALDLITARTADLETYKKDYKKELNIPNLIMLVSATSFTIASTFWPLALWMMILTGILYFLIGASFMRFEKAYKIHKSHDRLDAEGIANEIYAQVESK